MSNAPQVVEFLGGPRVLALWEVPVFDQTVPVFDWKMHVFDWRVPVSKGARALPAASSGPRIVRKKV